MDELRIPKIAVDIVCHTILKQTIEGQIFLDMVSAAGYQTSQILDFFNSSDPFFPLRISAGKSIVIRKQALFRIDVPGLFDEYETEVSSSLDLKREVILYCGISEKLQGRLIVGMPTDHSRVLDLFNAGRRFVPLLMEHTIAVINLDHVDQAEEL